MTLADIENMPLADLKAKRDELAKSLGDEIHPTEIAARYVQARADAKARDEKLAEQAGTLAALTQGLNAATEKADGLAAKLAEAGRSEERRSWEAAELEAQIDLLRREQYEAAKESADREAACRDRVKELEAALVAAVTLAKRRRAVLADLMAKVSPLLAEEG